MLRAYYQAPVSDFLRTGDDTILGELAKRHDFALEPQQRGAWLAQLLHLRSALSSASAGHLLLEFAIPRMGKRADAVLVSDGNVFVIEFKVGATGFDRDARDQAQDYALDLKNFHAGSHLVPIIPILVATSAPPGQRFDLRWGRDDVAEPLCTNAAELAECLIQCSSAVKRPPIDFDGWVSAGYQPTPTIVEAAQALYQQHQVKEIARSDAGAKNLNLTSKSIAEIIDRSKLLKRKSICFVTGVPGAGKTLAGLNVATKRAHEHSDEHAVFLSGNGPLVEVLREALARDQSKREVIPKAEAARKVQAFIQNIHHFRDEALRNSEPPFEKVVVFDEAQRAWTRQQATKFMATKRNNPAFDMSEPEFLVSVMDRHEDWCVIVCLVGGGQEINTGEAGITEWFNALRDRFSHWDVYAADRLLDADYATDPTVHQSLHALSVNWHDELHLAVSLRSFRAEAVSAFVNHVVEGRQVDARRRYQDIATRYPIFLTRDLETAKQWLRRNARGSERYGLLASSGALRLRPEGLHVKAKVDAPIWFLNDRHDVRSSYYCEEVATEFDIQGLELDWTAVCWDADYRRCNGSWSCHNFSGSKWQHMRAGEARSFLKNAYRVILTRARQGMVIFVPRGDDTDLTRPSAFYDETFEYLKECGLSGLG